MLESSVEIDWADESRSTSQCVIAGLLTCILQPHFRPIVVGQDLVMGHKMTIVAC